MRPDQDVDLAARKPRHRLALLGRGAEPRDVLDRDGVILEPLRERPVVLLGEDRRRHQQHHLLAVLDRLERGAQRDLGLAVADVATDQAVHRPWRLHVGLDEFDRVALVRGLHVREGVLEVALPVGVEGESVSLAAPALGVKVQKLPREFLCRAPRPGLDRVPACPAQLRQRRVGAAGADVAADLRQLVDGHEHPVGAGVLEIQVVAGDVRHGLGVKPGEPGDPVVLVDDDVAGAEVREAAQYAPPVRPLGPLGGAAPVEEPVVGDHREVELRRDEADLEAGVSKRERAGAVDGLGAGIEPAHLQAAQVVRGALALAAPRERDHRPVARPRQLLELWLGLLQPSGGDIGALGTERERLVLVDAREPDPRPLLERGTDLVRSHVQVMGVLVVKGGGDVLPVVRQCRRHLLLAGDQHGRVRRRQRQERVELVDRQELGDVGPVGLILERGDLSQLAVLLRQLRRGGHLDHVGIAEGALRERREPAQRLDLIAEQIDPHCPVLRRREHIEQAAADRELAAVLDLLDPLVSRGDEIERRLVEVEQLAHPQREAAGTQRGIGDLFRQRHRAHDHDRRRALGRLQQRVERGDSQPDQMRRRGQMGFVGDAAARVVADRPRLEPRSERAGQVARRPVIAGDHDRRALWRAVDQRRDQVRAQ